MRITKTDLFALMAIFLLCAATAAPMRVAVVPGEGERAPKAGVAELLTSELSRQDGVVVLEREEVRRILAEQALSAAGLVDRATSIRAGRILHADAFLALERLGQGNDQQYRIKVIEARTGLVAGDRFVEASVLEQTPAAAAADLCRSLAWLRIPDDNDPQDPSWLIISEIAFFGNSAP